MQVCLPDTNLDPGMSDTLSPFRVPCYWFPEYELLDPVHYDYFRDSIPSRLRIAADKLALFPTIPTVTFHKMTSLTKFTRNVD